MMHVFPKNAWEPPNIHEINIHFGAGNQGILKCIQILKDVSCNKCIVWFSLRTLHFFGTHIGRDQSCRANLWVIVMDFPCNDAVSPQSRHALTTNLYEAIGRHFFWALGRQFQRAHVKRPGSRRMSGPTGGGRRRI